MGPPRAGSVGVAFWAGGRVLVVRSPCLLGPRPRSVSLPPALASAMLRNFQLSVAFFCFSQAFAGSISVFAVLSCTA